MKLSSIAWIALLSTLSVWSSLPQAVGQTPIQIAKITRTTSVSFQKEILPILRNNCLACHSASEADGELVLESPQSMLKGGDTGPAIIAGKGAESLLIQLASHQDDPAMPPPNNKVAAKPLTPQELGLIKLWIDQGAQGSSLDSVLSPTNWRQLPPGPNPIYAVAVTPDGQFAACSRANQIFIYHVPTGQLITRLNDENLQAQTKDKLPGIAHLDVVQSLAFNRQGDRLASGGFRTAKIWRYPRDVQRLTIDAATDVVNAVAVSPDKQWFATGAADHSIKVWKVDTGEAVTALAGHTDAVTSLRFSRDSTKLYSSSLDKSILVWNLEDSKLAGRIVTPTPVNAITTVQKPLPIPVESTGGESTIPETTSAAPAEPQVVEMLVSGGDNVVRLWDLPGTLPQSLADNLSKANVLAVSPDRNWLAVANATGEVQVRNLITGEIGKSWQAHEAVVNALSFAPMPKTPVEKPDAKPELTTDEGAPPPLLRLATASADRSVRIWNAETGELLTSLRGSPVSIDSLTFRADGLRLVAGAADGRVTEWNLETAPASQLATQTQPAMVAAVSPDGKLIATGDLSNGRPAIIVRDIATGATTATLLGHSGPLTSLAFSSDNTRLVSGSEDKTARVWDLRDAKFPEVVRFTGHAGAVRAVAFNPGTTQVLSGADDNSLKQWAVADGSEQVNFAGHTAPVIGVAITRANQPISASADKTIRVWNLANGQVVRSTLETAAISALTLSRDSARLAIATAENKVKVFQVSDGKLLLTLEGHAAPVHSLSFSFDNTRLVSADASDANVWRASDGRLLEILSHKSPWSIAAYGASNDTLLFGDATNDLHQQTVRFSAAFGDMKQGVTSVAYRTDGQVVYTSSADGTVRGFNVTNGQQLFAANHGVAVHQIALSPDGLMLASAGEDKQVKLWNASNGAALAPAALAGFSGPVRSICFAAAGKKIIAASSGATPDVFVFGLPDGKLEQVLSGQAAAVESLATIGDEGVRVIAATVDGVATVWQLLSARRVNGHTAAITSLAPVDQLQVISGSEDGTLRRWNLAATTPQLAQMNHGAPITGVAVRADGQRFASVSSNKTAKLWNAANNAQLAEMRGDLRAKTLVAKLTRQKTDWTAKVAAAKTSLAAAEKDLPTKTQTEKQAATTVATAEKDVSTKAAALATASTAKAQAEGSAIQAAAAAQAAAVKMEQVNQLALSMTAKATLLAEKAAQARAVAQAEPTNAQLAKLATDMTTVAATADAEAKKAMAAKTQPTQAAQAASQLAATAATKAVQMGKPFTDASTALTQSQAALKTAKQLHNSAVRDLKQSTDAVPAAKAQVAKSEVALKQTDTELAAAVKAEVDAQQPFRCVQFSPDGRTLASGGDLGVVHTWDADSGKAVNSYVGHAGQMQSLFYVSDGELVTGSTDKKAAVWNLNPSWELERVIGDINDPSVLVDRVVAVDFSQDGRLLATGGGVPSRSGEVRIWNVDDGSLAHSLPDAHTDGVNAVAFSPDDSFLASAGADKFVKKWDVATGKQLVQFEGHTSHVLGVTWRANGQRLASSGAEGRIQIWNAVTGDRVRNIAGYTKQVTSVRFVGETQFIVSTSGDRIVRMHNSDNGGVQRNFAGATDYMYCVDVTPDTSIVVAGGHDGILRIWNGTNAQVVQTIGPPKTDEELAANP
jgi:WD40 repeat protein